MLCAGHARAFYDWKVLVMRSLFVQDYEFSVSPCVSSKHFHSYKSHIITENYYVNFTCVKGLYNYAPVERVLQT